MQNRYCFDVESDIDDLSQELAELQARYSVEPTAVTAALIACYLSKLAHHSENESVHLCWKAEKYWEAKALSIDFKWTESTQGHL